MPDLFNALGKMNCMYVRPIFQCQTFCIYPAAFESEDQRDGNFSFPDDVNYEDVTMTTSDNITLKCYLLRASQRQSGAGTPNSRRSETSFPRVANSGVPRALVLMFHGNGYHAWHHAYSGQQFLRLNCDVLIVSYRGYGRSLGRPSEKGLRRDAQAALDYALADQELSKSHIILHGHSLGGAVAIDLAARNPAKISGLILENTFLSIPAVAKEIPCVRHFTFFIHQKWKSYERISRIPKSVPILMLSGKEDEVVPESHMLKLWELAATRGQGSDKDTTLSQSEREKSKVVDGSNDMFRSIPRGTHADTWTRPGYWQTINAFLENMKL